uniref:Glycosyl transferase CAP10 domain-containing protein n=1 Tax=Brassica oleracea var. oleracea TaxID=109376 RepID=A0A0D3BQ72_BRAOL
TTLAGLKQVTTTIIKPPIKTLHRFPRQCGVVQNQTQPVFEPRNSHSRSSTCPSYFRWIHEDLRPWRETGVTRGMLEKARRKAHFRVIIRDVTYRFGATTGWVFTADERGARLLLLESTSTLEDFKRMVLEDFDMEEDSLPDLELSYLPNELINTSTCPPVIIANDRQLQNFVCFVQKCVSTRLCVTSKAKVENLNEPDFDLNKSPADSTTAQEEGNSVDRGNEPAPVFVERQCEEKKEKIRRVEVDEDAYHADTMISAKEDLLQWYPGRLPDLELLFDADDRPTVRSSDYRGQQHPAPPPVFRYCSNDANLDIVFPDWSFWGWAELNIKPWAKSLVAIEEGNKMTQWEDRVPYAYWRGNPNVARTRRDLLRCNVSDQGDWNTRLYINDWATEFKEGFKNSNLENQCTHRYKIYIEGWAWSVSEKYIMACDSMTLYVRPTYYDFLIRGMVPLQHYWPIRDLGKCRSLKHAVHWGNTHLDQARKIGEEGSRYIREEVNMEFVYDYMFHLVNEYAKLLKFKPEIPLGAKEITTDSMGCPAKGRWRDFMAESMVMSPSEVSPCVMPLPYSTLELKEVLKRKANLTRQVEVWEDQYYRNLTNPNKH